MAQQQGPFPPQDPSVLQPGRQFSAPQPGQFTSAPPHSGGRRTLAFGLYLGIFALEFLLVLVNVVIVPRLPLVLGTTALTTGSIAGGLSLAINVLMLALAITALALAPAATAARRATALVMAIAGLLVAYGSVTIFVMIVNISDMSVEPSTFLWLFVLIGSVASVVCTALLVFGWQVMIGAGRQANAVAAGGVAVIVLVQAPVLLQPALDMAMPGPWSLLRVVLSLSVPVLAALTLVVCARLDSRASLRPRGSGHHPGLGGRPW